MKKIVPIVLLIIIIFLCNRTYYDYGVDTEKSNLPYRTYYYGERNEKYDFNTVIFSSKDLNKSINYSFFNIFISHLVIDKNSYISTLIFDNIKNTKLKIFPNSIKLVHTDNSGKLLKHNEIIKKFNEKACTGTYTKKYNKDSIPSKLIEYIYFEFELDGQKHIIDKKFIIEKVAHYTFFDILMGM